MSTGSYCPECDEGFNSERAVKIHYGHSHSGNLPNNTCSSCGKDFYHPSRNDRVYCDSCFRYIKGLKKNQIIFVFLKIKNGKKCLRIKDFTTKIEKKKYQEPLKIDKETNSENL